MAWKYCSSSQQTVIRSASSRSSGDGFSPAISFLISLRLRGIASWVNTSSPDIFSIMLRSTFLARSTIRATLGSSSSTFLSTGRASSSPSCALSIRAISFALSLISSEVLSLCLVALVAFLGLTPQPPFSPVVLTIPAGEQGSPDQKIRSLRKFCHRSFQGVEILLLFLPTCRLLLPAFALQGIHLCGHFSEDAASDVLPDHPAGFLARAGVVEAAALATLPGAQWAYPRCVTSSRLPRFSSKLVFLRRARFDSAMRWRPSSVLGPVESPPCILQRPFTGPSRRRSQTAGAWHGLPSLHLAPHRGRSRLVRDHRRRISPLQRS